MSCSHDPQDDNSKQPDNNVHEWVDSTLSGDAVMGEKMIFKVGGGMSVERSEGTRASTDVNGIAKFTVNDLVTIGVTRGATDETKNYKVTATSQTSTAPEVWTSSLAYNGSASDAFFWKSTGESVTIRAWSYGDGSTTSSDPDNQTYTLSEDQSANYGELLYSKATSFDYENYSSGIPIQFCHQMTRLVINVTHIKPGDLDISEIYIGDGNETPIPTTAKFHKPTSGNVGTWDNIGSEKGQITPKTETANSCYSAVLIPTTYEVADKKFVVIKTSDGRTYCYIPNENLTLIAGTQYSYTISVKDLKEVSTLTIGDIAAYTYDGTAKTPTPTVKDGTKTLVKDTDYELSYSNNINAGTATVTVTGKGGYYSGSQSKNFTIAKAASAVTTAPTAATGLGYSTYTGATQTLLSSSGTVTGGTMMYMVKTTNSAPSVDDSGWTTTIPTALVADTYYVYYYVKGDDNHNNTSVSTPLTVNVTATRTYDVKMNPLWYVATYNMTNQTTMASSANAGYYFNWSTAMSYFAASTSAYSDYRTANKTITGQSGKWHLPVIEEWYSIVPAGPTSTNENQNVVSYISSANTASYKSAYITTKFGYNTTTKAGISESSYFRYVSNSEIHAIRFLGTNYCSAWIWKYSGGSVVIYATLIDVVANNLSSAASWYNNHSWNGSGEHIITFGNNDSKYAAQRSIGMLGYKEEGNSSTADIYASAQSYAAYWSTTQKNGSSTGRVYYTRNSDGGFSLLSYFWSQPQHGFNVRLFKDN